MHPAKWFQVLKPLSAGSKFVLGLLSFVLPIVAWSIVSYVPSVWHPQVRITDPGSVDYLQIDMRMDKAAFQDEVGNALKEHRKPPQGVASNPIYLPAPDQVLKAFYVSFTMHPRRRMGRG